jgi:tetratricopeptide (TPR) repeat protein
LSKEELRKSFSYALEYIDNSCLNSADAGNGVLCEKAVAEISFIEAERPGLLEEVSGSDEAFSHFFINNFWSAQTASRLAALRPFFIAHLAEMERRRGRFGKALSLLEAASRPGRPYYKLIKGRALLGLGRKKEGKLELEALFNDPALGRAALTVAAAYGVSVPAAVPATAEPVSQKARADSKTLSDKAVEKIRSGDLPAAERMLYAARKLNPANAEALLNLCSLEFSKGGFTKSLDACGAVSGAAALDRHPARQTMAADALYIKALVFQKMGQPLEAEKYLKLALAAAPKGWANLARAREDLGSLKAKALP